MPPTPTPLAADPALSEYFSSINNVDISLWYFADYAVQAWNAGNDSGLTLLIQVVIVSAIIIGGAAAIVMMVQQSTAD